VLGGDARGAAAIFPRDDGEWTDLKDAAKSSFTAAGPQKERVRKAEEYANVPPTLPPGCRYSFVASSQATADDDDDDDAVSMNLTWPQSLHCSNAGLTAVPQPLPSSLEYM
jgi:hypothetical protein